MSTSHSLPKKNWNRSTAAHLVNRAGFGPSATLWNELTALSPEEAVEKMLAPPAVPATETSPEWCSEDTAMLRAPEGMDRKMMRMMEDMKRREVQREFRKQNGQNLRQLTTWWVKRMATSEQPFEEKLTLFWHNHFATSYQKVRHATPMWSQNMMFREQGRGNWGEMLEAVTADPAMLVYLDNHRSNKRKPNENYARELMELFTLGEGHYTEDDILAAARAFTGWTLNRQRWEFSFNPRRHDFGMKTFMGETGKLSGEDVLAKIASLPRSSEYLASRLWKFFASDTPNEQAIHDIAHAFREGEGTIESALRALFLHEAFYDPSVIRGKIKSPVDLTVGFIRSAQPRKAPYAQAHRTCKDLGQNLFHPPSVKGWDGGSTWITASSLALRYQRLEKFIQKGRNLDIDTLIPDRSISREELRDDLLERFYFSTLRPQDRQAFDAVLESLPPPSSMNWRHLGTAVGHLIQQPQYQLC